MEYKDAVKDFVARTKKNLETLRRLQEENPGLEIYEFTQLVNSLLGLLVFPQQRYVNKIPAIPLSKLFAKGWPIPQVVGDFPQAKDLNQLVRYLRNAIAHFNIEFTVDEHSQLNGLKIWNENHGTTTWKAQLSLAEIEELTYRFIELILESDTGSNVQ